MGMDLTLLAFMLGVCFMLWIGTVGAGAYCFWRYCYKPWVVTRADHKALVGSVEALRTEIGARRVQSLSADDLARAERNERMRTLRAAVEGGNPVAY